MYFFGSSQLLNFHIRKGYDEMSAIVTLKKGEGRTIKAGGAFIYDNEIASIMGSFENGDIVIIKDFDGYPMGCLLYTSPSPRD